MDVILAGLFIITGAICGIVWYVKIDLPREKFIKTGANEEVVVDGNQAIYHVDNGGDSDFGGMEG